MLQARQVRKSVWNRSLESAVAQVENLQLVKLTERLGQRSLEVIPPKAHHL